MNYRCYTLSAFLPEEGIDTSAYDCIVTDTDDRMLYASVQMISALTDDKFDNQTKAELSLAFIKQTSDASCEPGALVSVDTQTWQPYSNSCKFMLLDPGGADGHVLLFIPADSSNVLISKLDNNKLCTLSTTASGLLLIGRQSRGAAMLEALKPIAVFPAKSPQPERSVEAIPVAEEQHCPQQDTVDWQSHPSAEIRRRTGLIS